jgi:hypothetical protein
MRFALFGAALTLALLAGFSSDANAQHRRVCAMYSDRSMLCYYDNFKQCWEYAFGLRATCIPNPGYDAERDRRSRNPR